VFLDTDTSSRAAMRTSPGVRARRARRGKRIWPANAFAIWSPPSGRSQWRHRAVRCRRRRTIAKPTAVVSLAAWRTTPHDSERRTPRG